MVSKTGRTRFATSSAQYSGEPSPTTCMSHRSGATKIGSVSSNRLLCTRSTDRTKELPPASTTARASSVGHEVCDREATRLDHLSHSQRHRRACSMPIAAAIPNPCSSRAGHRPRRNGRRSPGSKHLRKRCLAGSRNPMMRITHHLEKLLAQVGPAGKLAARSLHAFAGWNPVRKVLRPSCGLQCPNRPGSAGGTGARSGTRGCRCGRAASANRAHGSMIQTGLPMAPARCATEVSTVTTRSSASRMDIVST